MSIAFEHDGCVGCKYERESETSSYCQGCKQNAIDKYERMTNADKIRSMADDELAEFLHNIHDYFEEGEPLLSLSIGNGDDIVIGDSYGDIKEWLEREVEE